MPICWTRFCFTVCEWPRSGDTTWPWRQLMQTENLTSEKSQCYCAPLKLIQWFLLQCSKQALACLKLQSCEMVFKNALFCIFEFHRNFYCALSVSFVCVFLLPNFDKNKMWASDLTLMSAFLLSFFYFVLFLAFLMALYFLLLYVYYLINRFIAGDHWL